MPLGHWRDLPTLRAQCRFCAFAYLRCYGLFPFLYHSLLPFAILRTLTGCGEQAATRYRN